MIIADNLHSAIFSLAAYTVILCFSLFKSGALAKDVYKRQALVFDERTDRYDIRFDLNSYYGGLHCGECFDAVSYTHLIHVRIEA